MYFKCNTNVPGASRILPEYFPKWYKMLSNLAFSLVNRCRVWYPLGDVALLQIASCSKICWKEMWRRLGKGGELMEELRVKDPQSFFNYLWMEPAVFDELVQRVGPRIEKHGTKMRKASQ